MKTPRTILFFILFSIVFSACNAFAPKSELELNREKWNQQNITHYRYTLRLSCFCAFMDKMPLTVEVQNGEVVSIVDATGATPSAQELEWYGEYTNAEKLFGYIQKAEAEADQHQVTYDPSTGLPAEVNIDWIELAMDDEMSLTISNFENLP